MAESSGALHAPSRIERFLLVALALALLGSLAAAGLRSRTLATRGDLLAAASRGYQNLWLEVDAEAARAARAFDGFDLEASDELDLFERAAAAISPDDPRGWSLFLLGPLGSMRAWSGAGLLHALDEDTLPQAGRAFRSSVTATSLLSILEIGGSSPWRLVVGISLPTEELPFALPGRAHLETRWGLAAPGTVAPGGRAAIDLAASPTLLIDEAELVTSPDGPPAGRWWSDPLTFAGAWLLLAATAFRSRLRWLTGLLAAAAVALWAWAALAPVGLIVGLALAVAAAFASLALARRRTAVPWAPWRGLLGAALLLAVAWALQRTELIDLAAHFVISGTAWVARTALFLCSLSWLGCLIAGAGEVGRGRGWRTIWLGALVVGSAAMAVDWPAIGAVLLLVGGTFLGVGLAAYDLRGRPLRLAGVAFLAALCAGTANEISYRSQLREQLAGPTLRALAPPSSEETMALREELELHFDGLDLADLAAGDIRQLEPSDLAFELWQRSPLARGRAVSAVSLRGDDGTRLTFSFGVPLDGSGRPQVQSRERPFDRPVWDYTLINEVAAVVLDQRPWGEIEYWLLVRPGFRLAAKRLDDVEGDLLQGGPSGRGAVQDQVRPASYAHYSSPRQVRITPWSEAPELPAEVIARGGGRIVTPDGPSWVWTAAEAEGWRALFLARLGPISAFERVGTEAIGTLWPLAIGLLAVFALGLSRRDFRERASDLWHSYSRRLVLLFSLLVLVPAVLVNVLVLRMLTDRIENEQLTKARRAMTAAQRVLGEYATTPDAGTSLNTIFDDDLMGWLAQVLDHEIHLYWATSGLLSASSQQELFGAGFLPKRIPGEVYAGLRLRGQRSASRVHRTGPTRYTELYGRLTVPGQDPQRADFLLSIPLLAQEVAVAAEIEAIRHPLVLGTTLLVLLLVALGARLAANFTTPLEELVEGTQRIAAGAESLDLEPKELELATLVDAIDRMAERIADGRRKLVQEKRVIERMVDNITAAVVSIDADHRVLMHNETARDLLGTTIGATLESAFAEGENPGKVLDGLRRSEKLGEPQAVRLPTGDEDETREWSLVWVPIPGEGEPKALVVVEDVTAVVRGQRLEAWAEMARIIAHEIKNPLTPIRLSAEHMRSLRERDPAGFDRVFDQCIDNILEHVEELRVISIEFSTYSRALSIEPEVGDLGAHVRELVAGYEVVQPDGVTVSFEEEDPVITAFDGRLLMRALRNLIENALRAVSGGGAVSVSVRRGEDGATITVSDTGPGVASAELGKIFDPYFSTHDSGTGLGLPIARRIVEEHGGEIHARNRQAGGLAVRVTLPLTESA